MNKTVRPFGYDRKTVRLYMKRLRERFDDTDSFENWLNKYNIEWDDSPMTLLQRRNFHPLWCWLND